ncbi:MAG: hypothetical protein HOC33_04990 [Alphaproteobacteria bacterium]|nr:hypothetical protein [Alphaproteobacteria bacterium]MBT4543183.1 hypothetical protein [Alphaproteobacteria bacterium]
MSNANIGFEKAPIPERPSSAKPVKFFNICITLVAFLSHNSEGKYFRVVSTGTFTANFDDLSAQVATGPK